MNNQRKSVASIGDALTLCWSLGFRNVAGRGGEASEAPPPLIRSPHRWTQRFEAYPMFSGALNSIMTNSTVHIGLLGQETDMAATNPEVATIGSGIAR